MKAKKRSRNVCPNFRLWLQKSTDEGIVIARARCKQWSCDYCAQLNAYQWQTRLRYAMFTTPGEWQFITFTAHEKWRGSASSYKNISENAGKLWKRYVRLCKAYTDKKLHYARLFEAHKDGSIHVHAFIRAPLEIYPALTSNMQEKRTQASHQGVLWLKKNSRECGMGYMVDVQGVDDKSKAIAYVTKYVSKSLFSLQIPRNARRIQTSNGFPTPKHLSRTGESDWSVNKRGYKVDTLRHLIASGFEVRDADLSKILEAGDLEGLPEYYT